jgi:hypothetical protein
MNEGVTKSPARFSLPTLATAEKRYAMASLFSTSTSKDEMFGFADFFIAFVL